MTQLFTWVLFDMPVVMILIARADDDRIYSTSDKFQDIKMYVYNEI